MAGSFNGRTARFERAYVGSIPTPASMFPPQGLVGEERSLIRIDSRDRHPDLRPLLCLCSSMEERRVVAPENADRNRAQVPAFAFFPKPAHAPDHVVRDCSGSCRRGVA